MSQICHCWIMQSSLWLCLSSTDPNWEAALLASIFGDTFKFLFSSGEKNTILSWLRTHSKMSRVESESTLLFEELCVLCFQHPSLSALWYCLLCWHGICSLPLCSLSLADSRSPPARPPRANRHRTIYYLLVMLNHSGRRFFLNAVMSFVQLTAN